jgi:hypothetical protein
MNVSPALQRRLSERHPLSVKRARAILCREPLATVLLLGPRGEADGMFDGEALLPPCVPPLWLFLRLMKLKMSIRMQKSTEAMMQQLS